MYEFKVSELAEEFGVHRNTIRNWIQSGVLPAHPGPGRKYFMLPEDYIALCEKYHIEPRIVDAPFKATAATKPRKSDIPPVYLPVQTHTPAIAPSQISMCTGCGACAGACPISGVDNLDPRKIIRTISLGIENSTLQFDWAWKCTLCAKCEESCPVDLKIVSLMLQLRRADNQQTSVASTLHRGVQTCLATGNNVGIPKEDFLDLCQSLGEELADSECPGFVTPLDVIGARIMVTVNSKEPFAEPENLKWWWKIFHAAGESWTIPADHWEGVNWAFFTGDDDAMRILTGRLIDSMRRLKCKVLLFPDCGHAYFAVRYSLQTWFPEVATEFQVMTSFDLLHEYIEEGRISLNKKFHSLSATYHDSCHHSRKSFQTFGETYDAKARKILHHCVQNFKELAPRGQSNYCCGAGGGSLALLFPRERLFAGRLKARQISDSGARLVITSCHNCRDQIMKCLSPEYGLDIEVKHLWEVVADALIIKDRVE